jgi:hypothetical protein
MGDGGTGHFHTHLQQMSTGLQASFFLRKILTSILSVSYCLHFTLSARHPLGLCTSHHPIYLIYLHNNLIHAHTKHFTQSLTYQSTFQPTIMDDFQSKALAAATSISYQTPAEALAQSLTNDAPKIDTAIKSYVALTSARVLSANSHSSVANAAAAPTGYDLDQGPICQSSDYHCYFSKSKNPQMASLFCAKVLLQKLNSFKIPMDDHDDDIVHHKAPSLEPEEKNEMNEIEFQVVRILWNGLVSHGKKPSKILGLEALYHVYPLLLQTLKENVPTNVDLQEGQMFMMEFGSLLQHAMNRRRRKSTLSTTNHKQDNDDDVDDDSCLLWDKDGGKKN